MIFEAVGSSADEADTIARNLVSANLAGHDSHGVIRVPQYVGLTREGLLRPNQRPRIDTDKESFAIIDGEHGFGQIVGETAMDLGVRKARRNAVAIIGIRNSGHLGRIGYWAERAAAFEVVSLHFVNSPGRGGLQVVPFGGRERRFAPNPLACGFPQADGPPIVLDITTSVLPEGKVRVARNKGVALPEGAAIDSVGAPTRDPNAFYGPPPGALLPLGGHKGSGLCMMVDLLAGALTSGGCAGSREVDGNNMLSVFIDAAQLRGDSELGATVAGAAAWVKSSAPISADGEVLVPGELEARRRADMLEHGIEVDEETWRQIVATAKSVGLNERHIAPEGTPPPPASPANPGVG